MTYILKKLYPGILDGNNQFQNCAKCCNMKMYTKMLTFQKKFTKKLTNVTESCVTMTQNRVPNNIAWT